MRFLRRPRKQSRCIAVFCGAFHPPTVAHEALAVAARQHVDEVLWVMPERFPHKVYEGVDLPGRLEMLLDATSDPVAVASESLFFPIAAEAESTLPGTSVQLLIGEDGARRILEWDYGLSTESHENYLQQQLSRFPILTAARQEQWELPPVLAGHFSWLNLDPELASVSSTIVRERLLRGEPWEHLVPASIRSHVSRFYGSGGMLKGQ